MEACPVSGAEIQSKQSVEYYSLILPGSGLTKCMIFEKTEVRRLVDASTPCIAQITTPPNIYDLVKAVITWYPIDTFEEWYFDNGYYLPNVSAPKRRI